MEMFFSWSVFAIDQFLDGEESSEDNNDINVSVNMVNTEAFPEEEDGDDGSILWQEKVGQDLIDIMGANMLT